MTANLRVTAAIAFALALSVVVMIATRTPAGAAADAVPGADVAITADGLAPSVITVTVGAKVTWHNGGGQTVWLSSEPLAGGEDPLFLPAIWRSGSAAGAGMSGYLTAAAGDWNSAPIPDGGGWTRAYPEIGTFVYFANHAPSITGRVIVLLDADKMIYVPAGEFKMGCNIVNDPNCYSDEIPLHSVNLDGYYIDKYEVTNDRYRKCVETGPCASPILVRSYLRPSYYDNQAFSAYPVVYVDWFQAAAFCAWEDKRLPTEAEWEMAARGPSDTRVYPWGDAARSCLLVNSFVGGDFCVGDTATVGSYPAGASPYGVMDMSGNVWEWVSDWYDSNYYSSSPASDPTGPGTGTVRTARGSSWNYDGTLRVLSDAGITRTAGATTGAFVAPARSDRNFLRLGDCGTRDASS